MNEWERNVDQQNARNAKLFKKHSSKNKNRHVQKTQSFSARSIPMERVPEENENENENKEAEAEAEVTEADEEKEKGGKRERDKSKDGMENEETRDWDIRRYSSQSNSHELSWERQSRDLSFDIHNDGSSHSDSTSSADDSSPSSSSSSSYDYNDGNEKEKEMEINIAEENEKEKNSYHVR